MAHTQTRKSVSVAILTHERLKAHCHEKGVAISGYLEEIVAEKLVEAGIVDPDELIAIRERNKNEVENVRKRNAAQPAHNAKRAAKAKADKLARDTPGHMLL